MNDDFIFFQQIISVDAYLLIRFLAMRALKNNDRTFNKPQRQTLNSNLISKFPFI